MEQEYTVRFTVQYETKVRCEPEDLEDLLCDIHIPEIENVKYVEDTYEVDSVEDAHGNEIDY